MATYSNYQLPNNTYQQPAPTDPYDPWAAPPATNSNSNNYSSSAPPASASNAVVPSYGPASSTSYGGNVQDRALADIMASQERAMVEAKQNGRSSRSKVMVNSNKKNDKNNDNSDKSGGILPQKKQLKKERKRQTFAGGAAGAAVGVLIGGPIGLVVCGAAGGYAANKVSKQGERREQRKFEQANFQKFAASSPAADSEFV